MKTITQKEYEDCRMTCETRIGRVLLPDSKKNIYFKVDSEESPSAVEILDSLTLIDLNIQTGKYQVFRHWDTNKETEEIEYELPKECPFDKNAPGSTDIDVRKID